MSISIEQIKGMLDIALLKPTATAAEVDALAATIAKDGFRYLCVNSFHVARAAANLRGTAANVVACVGFPQGAVRTLTKVFETERAVEDGADEIDMVLNLGAFLGGDRESAVDDVSAVVRAAGGRPVKLIIETPFLRRQQKVDASLIARDGGASFVKTCTGTSPDPVALYEDVRLIRETVGTTMRIKASGRIGTWFRFQNMVEAGADRIGLVLEQAREILHGWEEEHG